MRRCRNVFSVHINSLITKQFEQVLITFNYLVPVFNTVVINSYMKSRSKPGLQFVQIALKSEDCWLNIPYCNEVITSNCQIAGNCCSCSCVKVSVCEAPHSRISQLLLKTRRLPEIAVLSIIADSPFYIYISPYIQMYARDGGFNTLPIKIMFQWSSFQIPTGS